MKIAIKYCGGCNPTYDRADVVNNLKQYIGEDHSIETAKQGILYDIVVILCGCTCACVNRENLKSKYGEICLTCKSDNSKLFDFIDKIKFYS